IRERVRFFFSSRRRHTRFSRDWSSDVCSSDLNLVHYVLLAPAEVRVPPDPNIGGSWTLYATHPSLAGGMAVHARKMIQIGRWAGCDEHAFEQRHPISHRTASVIGPKLQPCVWIEFMLPVQAK